MLLEICMAFAYNIRWPFLFFFVRFLNIYSFKFFIPRFYEKKREIMIVVLFICQAMTNLSMVFFWYLDCLSLVVFVEVVVIAISKTDFPDTKWKITCMWNVMTNYVMHNMCTHTHTLSIYNFLIALLYFSIIIWLRGTRQLCCCWW